MKKKLFLLCVSLAMIACEQSELDNLVNVGAENPVQTKAIAASIADFSVVDGLSDVPVNILSVRNTGNRYLSCTQSNETVDLYNCDDGSGRQQWLFKYGGLVIYGGHTGIAENVCGALVPNTVWTNTQPTSVLLRNIEITTGLPPIFALPKWNVECDGEEYVKLVCPFATSSFPVSITNYYLVASSQNSNSLSLLESPGNSALSQWQIVPIGEFELIDLQYVRTTTDNFDIQSVICDEDVYNNTTSSTQTWDYSVSVPFVETSNFSNTEGVKVNMSHSASVGIPDVAGEGSSVNLNTTFQQQASHSYTYGGSSQMSVTRTRTGHIEVKPYSSVKLIATLFSYSGTLTYVATLKKVGSNDTIKVKGKWSGTCFSKFEADVYELSTNKLLNTIVLE